jgi:hypothetical protein
MVAKKASAKKKTTTKKTTKKSTTKKASKKVSSKLLKDVPKENYFILCNGHPVKNIKELADVFEDLEDHVFNHHVRAGDSDFSKWVEHIIKDTELAKKLAGAADKKHLQLIIYKHIVHKTHK